MEQSSGNHTPIVRQLLGLLLEVNRAHPTDIGDTYPWEMWQERQKHY